MPRAKIEDEKLHNEHGDLRAFVVDPVPVYFESYQGKKELRPNAILALNLQIQQSRLFSKKITGQP